ncbi:MAG TPA: hypothetical protein VI455_07155 [Terriglobia bacterium]
MPSDAGEVASGNSQWDWTFRMKVAGFLLLLAGWGIVLAAVALLASTTRVDFVLAGIGVELLGLVIVVHSHQESR